MTDAAKALEALTQLKSQLDQCDDDFDWSGFAVMFDGKHARTIEHALRILANKDDKLCVVSRETIKRVGIAGNHLGLCLDSMHPSHGASYDDGLKHYGPGKAFEIWTAWKICYEVYTGLINAHTGDGT